MFEKQSSTAIITLIEICECLIKTLPPKQKCYKENLRNNIFKIFLRISFKSFL